MVLSASIYRIKKVGVTSIVKFFGIVGLIWGFLSGLILLASYIQGYLTNGQASLLQAGLLGFAMMIVFGVIGGIIGGALTAVVYNRVLGEKHGIEMSLEIKG